MESLLKNLKDYVKCSICLGTFADPKTISCLHTFCCECLKKHALASQRDGKFRCPECQAEFAIPDRFDKLPTGFLQNSLQSLLAIQQSSDGGAIRCNNCSVQSAETNFCFQCAKFMCPDCANAHEVMRKIAFQGHKVKSVQRFAPEDYEALLRRQSFCSQPYHEREVTRFFCIHCQAPVCQICIVTDHKNHTVDPLDKAADAVKAKVMEEAGFLEEKTAVCNDMIRELEQRASVLESNTNAAKRFVSQTAEKMIAKIREGEQEAMITLENTHALRMEKFDAAQTQIQSLVKQLNQAVVFVKNLVQRSSGLDIMQSKVNMEKRFEELIKTQVPKTCAPVSSFVKFVSTAKPENLHLGFVAGTEADLYRSNVEGLNQDFQAGVEGTFIVCPNLMRAAGKGQKKFGIPKIPSVEVHVQPSEQVESLFTSKETNGTFRVEFTPKAPGTYNIQVIVNGKNIHGSPFAIQVNQRRLESVGELDLKEETLQTPDGIAVNSKGMIVVADWSGHCILIFDKEGMFLRKFGSKGEDIGQLNRPSGIAFLNDEQILVADQLNHRIQQFNVHTGEVEKSFGKRGTKEGEFQNPVSLCIDDEGRIVVGDYSNNRIQVFSKDGEPVFKFGDKGPGKLDRPTGCVFNQSNFIVSDNGNNCLKIYGKSGRFRDKIGHWQGKGDKQFNGPRALCVEKIGSRQNILVCDRNNKRVVAFSLEGSFIGKTVIKLQQPSGIATTPDGWILVSDFHAKKVYVLK